MLGFHVFDTSAPGPRSDGEMATRRATLTKYRLRTKSVKHPLLRRIQFSSRDDLIQFIAGRYARKYLVGEPLLARPGEPGYDPGVEREVQAAMGHYRPSEAIKKKGVRQLKQKILVPGVIRREGPAGTFMQRIVKMVNPFSKKRADIARQQRELITPPREPEAPPPEFLPKQGRKTPVRGSSYEGGELPRGMWDPREAAKPTKIKIVRAGHGQRPTKPLTPEEVSARALQYRDPMASHEARVKAGLTPSLIKEVEKPKKGLPKRYLEKGVADVERMQAQAIRDALAGKLRGQRKLLQLYRTKQREALGMPAVKPLSKTAWKQLRRTSAKVPDIEIARGHTPERPAIKPYIPVPGGAIHPGELAKRHGEFEARVKEIADIHKAKAQAIGQRMEDRLVDAFERKSAVYGKTARDAARNLKNGVFSRENLHPENWQFRTLAEHLDAPEDWVRQQHRRFIHHRTLGEAYTGGEEKIRAALLPHLVKKLPSFKPEPPPSYGAIKAIGKRIGIGAGGLAAAGLAGYGGYKLLKRKKEHQFEAPGVQSALGNIQSKLKGWAQRYPNFSREAITAGSLVGGLSAADAAVSAIHPDPGKTRGQSALIGAQRGALYGGVLAGAEPLIRRPLMKRFLGDPNLMQSKLREIRFKVNNEDTTKRDIAIGAIEAGVAFPATERAVRWLHPKTGPGRALAAGAVGGLATGTIGYGLNRFVRAFKQKQRQKRTQEMAAKIPYGKLKEIRFNLPNITYDSEGYNAAYLPGKRRVTVAQDRYRKLVRQHEIARQEGNIAASAGTGAAVSHLLRHRTGLGVKSSLVTGAGAGALAEAGLIAHGQRTKDPFGEESIGEKRIERLPWQAAGLGAAGIAGHRFLRKSHILSNRSPLVRFQQVIPIDYQPKEPLYVREAGRFLRHPASRTEAFLKWQGRLGRLHRDIRASKKGGMVIDERGRPRTPEYHKPWFKRALITGGAVGGALLIHKGIKGLKRAAAIGAGLQEQKLPISKGQQFAIDVLAPGNLRAAIRSKAQRHFPGMFAGAGKVKEKAGTLRGEFRSMKERVLGRAGASIERETGAVQAGLRRSEEGLITGIRVTNPAERKAHLERIEHEQGLLEKRQEHLARQKRQVSKISPAREAVEEIHKKKFEPDIPPTTMRSRLKEIHFQYGDWVQVKPHYRKPRSDQPLRKKKAFREGALGALAVGGTAIGAGGGTVYGIHRILNREALARKASEDLEKEIARRAAQIRGRLHVIK